MLRKYEFSAVLIMQLISERTPRSNLPCALHLSISAYLEELRSYIGGFDKKLSHASNGRAQGWMPGRDELNERS